MTDIASLQALREQVDRLIEHWASDPEMSHAGKDYIYVAVLRAIAAGHVDAAELANQALRLADHDGTRWYA